MTDRAIRVATNIKGFESIAPDGIGLELIAASESDRDFICQCRRSDLVIIDNNWRKLTLACVLRPFSGFRLVSVDLVLRRGKGARARFAQAAKRALLSYVDRFLLYFKDIKGYQELYGIGPDRVVYVPFKVNGREQASLWSENPPDGDYVLCAGRSRRDIGTFVVAMRQAGCPGVLLQQLPEFLKGHEISVGPDELPPNLRRVVDESDSLESFLGFIAGAKLVVIPRFRDDIAATGVSTYLMAMAMRKCVIISRGPGADDVLTDEAAFVEPEDAGELAGQIAHLWCDDDLRAQIAARGRHYAEALGGERRLLSDILRESLLSLGESRGWKWPLITNRSG
jgi:glycosyltransferase involved in cell wall biosynthesis